MAQTLEADAPDPQVRALAAEFGQAHTELGTKYAAALEAFIQAKCLNVRDVDKMVKGMDRTPTARVDKIVDLLRERVNAQRASQKQALAAQSWAIGVVLMLAFGGIAAGAVVTVRTLSRTLRETATE